MESVKEFVDLLRTDFYDKLSKKTGWGKNEILFLFEICVMDSLVNLIDREKRRRGK